MDTTTNNTSSNADQSTVEAPSTSVQTDPMAELLAMRTRLAKLESEKVEADRQAAERASVNKIAAAKATVIANYLAGDLELDSFLPNTEDMATLEAAALKLQKKFKALRPNFGIDKPGGMSVLEYAKTLETRQPIPASQLIQRAFKPRD